jgi:hypothetical protein
LIDAATACLSQIRSRIENEVDMTVDEFILQALQGEAVTVRDIGKRFESHVRLRLNKLRVRGIVLREGRGGAHRKFTYKLLRPELGAKALRGKGGLARAAKAPRNTDESELLG